MADTNTYDSFKKVEKWTTKEKFNALGNLTEIETGTEYNLAGAIEENDLDSDLQTKINNKLTAPTTPTAESAVTMLADGTVGTKPLSEIGGGGGGGNLYIHSITITVDNSKVIKGNFLSTRGTNYAVTDDFVAYFLPGSTITINGVTNGMKCYSNMPSNGYRSYDYFNITTYEELGGPISGAPTFSQYYVTEV